LKRRVSGWHCQYFPGCCEEAPPEASKGQLLDNRHQIYMAFTGEIHNILANSGEATLRTYI